MTSPRSLPLVLALALAAPACGSTNNNPPGTAGTNGVAGTPSGGGVAGSTTVGGAGQSGSGGTTAGAGTGGSASGAGAGGAMGGGGGASGAGGIGGSSGGTGGVAGDPTLLSQTGLFVDIKASTKVLAPGVFKFAPAYALWSDNATKQRYVYMPPGGKIDTSDMNFWKYPGGFKLWKDFTRDNKLIETRLLLKKGDGLTDWYMVAFVWNQDYTEATATPGGLMNARDTLHDVPPKEACTGCHGAMHDHALGFSAVQLSKPMATDDLNIDQIAQMGWLSDMPPAGGYPLPGTDVEKKALGYLHANCGMCHHTGGQVYNTKTSFDAWAHIGQLQSTQQTRAYLSLVCDMWPAHLDSATYNDPPLAACPVGHALGAPMDITDLAMAKRVVPMKPDMSSIRILMSLRATGQADMMKQMPPLGTEDVDTVTGLPAIDAWINGLP